MASSFIRDVWAENVDAEFAAIRDAIVNYPYVTMVRTTCAAKRAAVATLPPYRQPRPPTEIFARLPGH